MYVKFDRVFRPYREARENRKIRNLVSYYSYYYLTRHLENISQPIFPSSWMAYSGTHVNAVG